MMLIQYRGLMERDEWKNLGMANLDPKPVDALNKSDQTTRKDV
jgi:hypothetical protein